MQNNHIIFKWEMFTRESSPGVVFFRSSDWPMFEPVEARLSDTKGWVARNSANQDYPIEAKSLLYALDQYAMYFPLNKTPESQEESFY